MAEGELLTTTEPAIEVDDLRVGVGRRVEIGREQPDADTLRTGMETLASSTSRAVAPCTRGLAGLVAAGPLRGTPVLTTAES